MTAWNYARTLQQRIKTKSESIALVIFLYTASSVCRLVYYRFLGKLQTILYCLCNRLQHAAVIFYKPYSPMKRNKNLLPRLIVVMWNQTRNVSEIFPYVLKIMNGAEQVIKIPKSISFRQNSRSLFKRAKNVFSFFLWCIRNI